MHNRALIFLIVATLFLGALLSVPEDFGTQVLSAQISRLTNFRLPLFFTGVDWFQVLANIANPRNKGNINSCKIEVGDVITTDERYTLGWSCEGSESPCTIYANGKVFSQVQGSGSMKLVMNQPAIFYTLRNRRNLPCNFQIAHQFQSSKNPREASSTASSTVISLALLTYADEDDFYDAIIDHTDDYLGLSPATATILATDNAATTSLRAAVADILSYTSDGTLTETEEELLSADNDALEALGSGLELIKVYVASSSENFLWIRETGALATKDSGANAVFRVNGYKTITGGGYSQNLIMQAPHWYDDSNSIYYTVREFVKARNARAIVLGTFTRGVINPTGTGSDSADLDDEGDFAGGTTLLTNIVGPGHITTNDLGIYFIWDETSSAAGDGLYFLPYGSSASSTIINDLATPNVLDIPISAAFVTSRRIIVADRGGDQFWCQDLDSSGEASGAPIITSFSGDPFDAEMMAVSVDGTVLVISEDPDLNTQAADAIITKFDLDPETCVVSSPTTIASGLGEIDNMALDGYGNLIFVEDDTANDRADVKYINNFVDGETTISTLLLGDSKLLLEHITGQHKLDDITVNSMAISAVDDRNIGIGSIFVSDDNADEIWTLVPTRDSSGDITGFERSQLTDFAATSYTNEGMAFDTNDDLLVLQENDSNVGTIYRMKNYSGIIIDTGNVNDTPRVIGYHQINEEIFEDINALHIQYHGYKESDWSPTLLCSTLYPVVASDGVKSPNDPLTFTYPVDVFNTAFNGWRSCAEDFFLIYPSETTVNLGALTNKQGEFSQATNTTIGVTDADIFVHFEMGGTIRTELATEGSDASERLREAHDGL